MVPQAAPKAWAQEAALGLEKKTPPPIVQWAKEATRRTRGTRGPKKFPGGLGGIPTDEEVFDNFGRVRVKRAVDLPTQVLLTQYLPPVAGQGAQNSCVAWSTAYYTYSYACNRAMARDEDDVRKKPNFQFSPAHMYNNINDGKDHGSQVGRGFAWLRDQGVSSMAEMPYDQTDYKSKPGESAQTKAQRYKGSKVVYLFKGRAFYGGGTADIKALKTFLAETKLPVVMAVPLFNDFPTGKVEDKDFVYNLSIEPQKDNFQGLHAVTCVGYDSDKKAIRIVNSWGSYWGDNGFLWLSEDFVRNWASEAWAVVNPGGPKSRGVSPTKWLGNAISVEPPKRAAKRAAKKL